MTSSPRIPMRGAFRLAWLVAAAAIWLGGCDAPLDAATFAQLEDVHSVAVVPFVDAHNASGSGDLVVTAAMKQLYRCSGVRVYERTQLRALIDEHDLMSATSDQEIASQLGQLTGVDAVILGEVTQYEAQQESSTVAVYVVAGSGTKHIHRVGMFVRAVRVSDGQIIYAESGEGVSNIGYTGAADIAAEQAFRPWLTAFRLRPSEAE